MLGFLNRFIDSNDREIKRIQPLVDQRTGLEPEFEALSDDEIRERIATIRAEIGEDAEPEEPSDDELDHPDARTSPRARQGAPAKRDNERIQNALDAALPEVFAAGPRGDASARSGCATSTSS